MTTTETYETLSFRTGKQANNNLIEIETHFSGRIIKSEILKGTDERGNYGFYVKYSLLK